MIPDFESRQFLQCFRSSTRPFPAIRKPRDHECALPSGAARVPPGYAQARDFDSRRMYLFSAWTSGKSAIRVQLRIDGDMRGWVGWAVGPIETLYSSRLTPI
jgi:hypothetical protein